MSTRVPPDAAVEPHVTVEVRPVPPRTVDDPRWMIAANRATVVARQLSTVVHEVNNALHIIHGNAELLEGPAMPTNVQRRAQVVGEQTLRVSALLMDLQRFARPDRSSAPSVDFDQIVEKALDYRRHALARRHIEVVADVSSGAWVQGDAWGLLLAVLNMLLNAEQALSDTPSPRVRVQVERVEDGPRVQLTVEDNGPGLEGGNGGAAVSATDLPRLGLGLSVTSWIAGQHGGALTWGPPPVGPGTVVRLDLPRA